MSIFKINTKRKATIKLLKDRLKENKIPFRVRKKKYYDFGIVGKKEKEIRLIFRKLKLDYVHIEADRVIDNVWMTDPEYCKLCNDNILGRKKEITHKEILAFLRNIRK